MTNKIKFITTPIFYPSGNVHIGTLHSVIIGDFFARAFKFIGYEVQFLTGLDEHGGKIENICNKLNIKSQEYVDNISTNFQDVFKLFHIDYNIFYRTTNINHKNKVQLMWKKSFIIDKDNIPDDAVQITEKVYYLKLSILRDKLYHLLLNNNIVIPKDRLNEIFSWIKDDIKDLCISRERLNWGINVPDGHGIIYVWIDALSNYINACEYPEINKYWSNVLHIIGKDITRFHTVYWLSILIALDVVPNNINILIHNWWTINGSKSSKSIGNVVDPILLFNKYGYAPIRFYILFQNLMANDSEFNEQNLVEYFNTYMVNKFSNLVYRVQSIINKNNIEIQSIQINNLFIDNITLAIEQHNINDVLSIFFQECDRLNKYIDDNKLWVNIHLINDLWPQIYNLILFCQVLIPFNYNNSIIFYKINYQI